MDYDKMYPKRFLKAGLFDKKDVTLTVASVRLEELEGNKGRETKGILAFKECKQQLVLNVTNGLCIKAMFGRETDAWVGKRITFYPMPIQSEFSDLAIRVRGSPDLKSPVTFSLILARKTPREMTMQVTRAANGKAQPPPPSPPPSDEPPPLGDSDIPPPVEP